MKFAYTARSPQFKDSPIPILTLRLQHNQNTPDIAVQGLLDTGATVNVLPYDTGIELGAVWREAQVKLPLAGNLGQFEARLLIATAWVANFEPVRLAFAWTEARHVPLILGHTNFFQEFDVCFYTRQHVFDITPATTNANGGTT